MKLCNVKLCQINVKGCIGFTNCGFKLFASPISPTLLMRKRWKVNDWASFLVLAILNSPSLTALVYRKRYFTSVFGFISVRLGSFQWCINYMRFQEEIRRNPYLQQGIATINFMACLMDMCNAVLVEKKLLGSIPIGGTNF